MGKLIVAACDAGAEIFNNIAVQDVMIKVLAYALHIAWKQRLSLSCHSLFAGLTFVPLAFLRKMG